MKILAVIMMLNCLFTIIMWFITDRDFNNSLGLMSSNVELVANTTEYNPEYIHLGMYRLMWKSQTTRTTAVNATYNSTEWVQYTCIQP